MVVIEKYIHFNSAPGSNGEKDFYNVMKKILPTKTGIALPSPMYTGDYVIIQSYWVLANVYDISQLSVVGFVQNSTNKEVYQSANLSLQTMTALHNNDVELSSFTNMIDNYCKTAFSPKVAIRNNGNTPLTSLDINYKVNDGEVMTYNWTGNLPFLGKTEIELPEISYELMDENHLQVYIDQVNQVADEYHKNDTLMHNFSSALQASRNILVKIRTDNSPEEVTWEIKNNNGEVVFSGGPYADANTIYNEETTLEADGCYEFFIYDAGGNGLCCTNGTGFYRISSGSVNIAQGTQFESEISAQFDVVSVGVNTLPVITEFEVYPNPASSQLFIEYTPERNRTVKINIFNQLGQSVYANEILSPSDLTQKLQINTGNWTSGIYMIRLDNGSGVSSSKLSISK
jgi:hypothetical protein